MAEQAGAERDGAPVRAVEHAPSPVEVELDVEQAVVGISAAGGERDDRDRSLPRDRASGLVVDRDHAAAGEATGEQPLLGSQVGRPVAVEVQVVVAEHREPGHAHACAVDAVQCQTVGGDLQRCHGHAPVDEPAQQPLEVRGLRRGAVVRRRRPVDPRPRGADDAGPEASGRSCGLDERDGRGLAVRPGDAHDGTATGRVVVDEGCDGPQRCPRGRHTDLGHVEVEVAFHEQGAGTPFDGPCGVVVPVGVRSGKGTEQVPGPHGPTVVHGVADDDVAVIGAADERTIGHGPHDRGQRCRHGRPRQLDGDGG